MILLGGVTMNFLLAWFLFTGLFWGVTNPAGMAPIAINSKIPTQTESLLVPTYEQAIDRGILKIAGVILDPIKDSPAEKSGIEAGDQVHTINGIGVQRAKDFMSRVTKNGEPIILSLTHSGAISPVDIVVTPVNGKIGTYVSDNIIDHNREYVYRFGFRAAVVEGAKETYHQSKLTLELLGNLFQKFVSPKTPTERTEATKSLTGPIGIGNLFIDLVSVKVPVSLIIAIAALISINLGVFNLLPFPALDGGRFAFLTIHTILGKLSRGKL